MNRSISLLVLCLCLGLSTFAQRQTWQIDPAFTSVQFTVKHLGISNVSGYFKSFGGNVTAESDDFKGALINFYVNSKSIHSENNIRDNELQSARFLASSRYPTILFESDQLIKVAPNKYKLKGILTIKGIEQSVEFDVDFGGLAKDAEGGTRAGFMVYGKIDRFMFGMESNEKIAGIPMVGKEISFLVNLQLVKST